MPSRTDVVRFLLLAGLMAVVYGQAPLYYSNQNQYFLHGLAAAGEGHLADDWLAGTRDPTPVFSALVAFTARWLHPTLFYAYYALLLGAYAAALLAVFRALVGLETAQRRWPTFLLLVLLLHSALVRWASYRFAGLDYPWYFQSGVAGQYLLGATLQPSAFGVLLLVAVALFLHDRPYQAAGCVGLAATLHSTYLLPGALLTAGFLTVLLQRRQFRRAVLQGGLTLLLVLPITAYVFTSFRATTPDTFQSAAHILTTFRIPHHCQVRLWLDPIAAGQIGGIALAVYLARRTPLAGLIGVPFALSALLTVAQVVSGSDTLALMFPWRISAVLVPLASTVVLSRLVAVLPVCDRSAVRWAALPLGGVLAAGGAWILYSHQGFQNNDNELGVLAFVRSHKVKGDVYVIPLTVPQLAETTHGSLSSDFKPLPGKRTDARIIPVDLQRFRLPTGAALYVDFKCIPYQDIDVLEWRRRIADVVEVQYNLRRGHGQDALKLLKNMGATHLVWHASQELADEHFELQYADPYYRVYRLNFPSPD